jgi:membrane protease YdiL (CAAX protease family)
MTSTISVVPPSRVHGPIRRFATAHPVAAFCAIAFPLGWPLLAIHTMTTFAPTMVGLAYTWVALLGSALAVTWAAGGRPAVARFLARYLIWRLGWRRWAVVVLALPALTVAAAAATGTLSVPGSSWLSVAGAFLLGTFVTGALEVNLAEEGAWSGLVQTRFTARHGLLRGALCTAPLFVAIHVPLQFGAGWTWDGVIVGVAVLAVVAPFFRYVIGETLEATGGSLLAAGVLHAAFNASGQLGFAGGWQFLPAIVVLALGLAAARRIRRRRGAAA